MEAVVAKKPLLNRILRIPDGQNLVYWMISKEQGWLWQFGALIGFALMFYFMTGFSVTGMMAMFVGVYLHEFGHYLVFVKNGIKTIILLLFPLGAVAAPESKEENEKSDLLPWWDISWLLLAGPAVNVLLVLVGAVLKNTAFSDFGNQLVYYNVMLALFNLLPLWNMDGGQLFHVVFSSLKEEFDTALAVVALVGVAVIIGIIFATTITGAGIYSFMIVLFNNFGLFVVLILLVAGIWHKQGKDNPLHSKSAQAMSLKQVGIILAVYASLLIVTLKFI